MGYDGRTLEPFSSYFRKHGARFDYLQTMKADEVIISTFMLTRNGQIQRANRVSKDADPGAVLAAFIRQHREDGNFPFLITTDGTPTDERTSRRDEQRAGSGFPAAE